MFARRIMSLWLPALALDRHRLVHGAEETGEPLVLIAETAHGPRIVALGAIARAAGACVGQMLADARTLCPGIVARPADPAGDTTLLERLAVWAMRWGPHCALDPPDGLLVDVTSVAHLFGSEKELLRDAHAAFARRQLALRAAIAPTAGSAWALAHFGPEHAILDPPRNGEAVIPPQLAELPVAALRLEEEVLVILRRLGLKRIGQLAAIAERRDAAGRDALQRRFRNRRSPAANPLLRLDQIAGRLGEPLLPVVPVEAPLVQRRLLEPIRHRSLLDQVLSDLAQELARRLESEALGARRLELGLWRVDGEVVARHLELAAASRDPAHVCRLFATRLDDVDAGFGIELVRLRAPWTEALQLAQSACIGEDDGKNERPGTSLATCIDRLTVRLGAKAVSRPVPFASHIPERAQRWQPPLADEPIAQGEFAFHARPLKLLDRPESIAVLYATPDGYPQRFRWRGRVHDVARVEGPERIAPEWWRERGTVRLRDYYRIEDSAGRRYWIYRGGLIGDGRGGMPQWWLQGLCA